MQRVSLRQSFHAAQSQQRTVGPPSIERFSVTKIVQYRTVVHSRWLETPVSILCSRIIQRHVQRITSSANLSRGPKPTEDCWATVNGTLLGNQNRPVPNSRPFKVARDSCLDSVQPNRSASRASHHLFCKAFTRPGANRGLLGHRQWNASR